MKTKLVCLFFSSLLLQVVLNTVRNSVNDADPPWSVRMAEAALSNRFYQHVNFYVGTTTIKGFRNLWQTSGNERYYLCMMDPVDANLPFYESIASEQEHYIDPVTGGSLVVFIFSPTEDSKYPSYPEQ